MKKYKATVNASGMWIETVLFAQNQTHAFVLFKSIFGLKNVFNQPQEIS